VAFCIWPPPTPFGLMTFFLAIGTRWKNLYVIVFALFCFVLDYIRAFSSKWFKTPSTTAWSFLINLRCSCVCKACIISVKVIVERSFVFSKEAIMLHIFPAPSPEFSQWVWNLETPFPTILSYWQYPTICLSIP